MLTSRGFFGRVGGVLAVALALAWLAFCVSVITPVVVAGVNGQPWPRATLGQLLVFVAVVAWGCRGQRRETPTS